ncbi:MarC family protein [Henriciella sp.]|uniref:MarC family protein n=1 Tax=Henriciella sp. TaxID=1968823 RepID=UPI002629CB52|nr:MarC family protein [Henriciella sp.]
MAGDFLTVFTASFVTFFVLIDAVGVAPIFASLTARGTPAYRANMAWRSIVVASIIIFGFAFCGAWLLEQLHITIDAFRAAGGVLLFLIALDMVFEKRTERRETRADEYLEEHEKPDDVSVFPIGIPMLAGPGSIATAMLFMSQSETWEQKGAVLSAIAVNMVLCLIVFLVASPLVKALGESVAGAITRIFGVILAALSTQLIIDGIIGAFNIG